MIHKKVAFKGEVYWLHEAEPGEYNLSPLDHYDDDGGLLANPFVDISFAVVLDDKIIRHSAQIGVMADLVDEPVQLSFDFEKDINA